MGYFNTTGFISQLPILGGNKVVCFIATTIKEINGLYSPSALVAPYFFPVYGDYNEYGYLENIQETFVTKILEKYSGVNNIEKLLEKISRGDETRLPKNVDYDEKYKREFTLLFEHQDVYERITEAPTFLTKYKDTMYEALNKYLEFLKKAKAANIKVIPRVPFSITNNLRNTDNELLCIDLPSELEEEYSNIIKNKKDAWKLSVFKDDDTMFLFEKLNNEDEILSMVEGKKELSKFLNIYALYLSIPGYFKPSNTAGKQQYSLKAFETIYKAIGIKLKEMKESTKKEE